MLQQEIPEWNNQLYDDIRSYAVSVGLPEDQVNSYVDPVVIKRSTRLVFSTKPSRLQPQRRKGSKRVLKSSKAPNQGKHEGSEAESHKGQVEEQS